MMPHITATPLAPPELSRVEPRRLYHTTYVFTDGSVRDLLTFHKTREDALEHARLWNVDFNTHPGYFDVMGRAVVHEVTVYVVAGDEVQADAAEAEGGAA